MNCQLFQIQSKCSRPLQPACSQASIAATCSQANAYKQLNLEGWATPLLILQSLAPGNADRHLQPSTEARVQHVSLTHIGIQVEQASVF
jgi:hypothetical protein